jgi:hypothetical protein
MYYNDSIAGSYADLMSFLPFGNFTLGGLASENKKQADKVYETYNETMSRLNIRSYIPETSIDHIVLGAHTASLMYNKVEKKFNDVMPHAIENVKVESLPFYSQEPIITVTFPDEVKALLSRPGKRMDAIRSMLGDEIVSKIKGGSLELDPLSTIFLPRKSFSNSAKGTSAFRRLLPIYLIEKNLFRGTIMESARRQRGILHVTLGDGDQWIPTREEMEFMTEQVMNADSDPLGAVLTTRPGVSAEELRQGGDFWKVTDFQDSAQASKLRALMISESFLSGEANWNTADNSLTIFIELLRAHRERIEYDLLLNKLFPLISLVNGFLKTTSGRLKVDSNIINSLNVEEALHKMNDGSKLFLPTVQWVKQLRPEGDSGYIEMLNTMSDKGVPVPLRMLAAAGGLSLDELLAQKDEDLKIRKDIQDYVTAIQKLAPAPEEGEESESSDNLLAALASGALGAKTRSSVFAKGGGRVSILDRHFMEGPSSKTRTGKKKSIVNEHLHNKKVDGAIAKAAEYKDKQERARRKSLMKKGR